MLDGIRIIGRVAARGAAFKALDRQRLDLTTPLGKGILAFLSTLAEDERSRILARAGSAAAKKRGVKFGPKPRLAAHQQREAVRTVREVRACVPSPTIITSTHRPSCPRCGTDIVVDLVSRDPAPVRGKPPFAHCSGVGSVTPQ